MKQLQNDYTTQEQSERLLFLGVPAWTANIMFDKNRRRYELIETEDESLAETQRTLFYNGGAIPHWSVGRLIEISLICGKGDRVPNEIYINKYSLVDSLVENIIYRLQRVADLNVNDIDFSKLEDDK